MGSIVANLGANLAAQLNAVVILPKVTVGVSAIVNRAQCTDFSNDLMPRMGVDRVEIQSIEEIQGENGPNGERVWKPINDIHDQVRFVGSGWVATVNTVGQRITTPVIGDYLEITFYGTGLNLLTLAYSTQDIRVSVDGGSEGSNIYPSSLSSLLNGRNYTTNQILTVASGLTLGLHTVKLRNNASTPAAEIHGFEVLNTSGSGTNTLQLTAGSAYQGSSLFSHTLVTDSYNSNFASTFGTAGTKGGHVAIYVTQGGTMAKSIQYTDATALFLASASHANESIIRTYNWREFGAGRSDDWSLLTSTRAASFTLDDGTTCMTSSTATGAFTGVVDTVQAASGGGGGQSYWFVFVGTGLDIVVANDNTSRTDTVTIDGTNVGTYTATANQNGIIKIASGLAYGTHAVKFTAGAGSSSAFTYKFIVYGPTLPTIPTGSMLVGDYYLMANYAIGTYTNDNGFSSQGVLRKTQVREAVYTGSGWSISVQGIDMNGFQVTTPTNGDAVQYTFYGTGVELHYSSTTVTYSAQITIDGATNFTVANSSPTGGAGWTAALTTATAGALTSFTASTGVLVSNTDNLNAKTVSINGLTLGFHTIKYSKISGSTSMFFQGLSIITPIHSPKSTGPGVLQGSLAVGSCGIGDDRKFPTLAVKSLSNWVQAVGVSSNPANTTTSLIPIADMSTPIKTLGNPIAISFSIYFVPTGSQGAQGSIAVFVDSVQVGHTFTMQVQNGNTGLMQSGDLIVPVGPGSHHVQVMFGCGSGVTQVAALTTLRSLKVREII